MDKRVTVTTGIHQYPREKDVIENMCYVQCATLYSITNIPPPRFYDPIIRMALAPGSQIGLK